MTPRYLRYEDGYQVYDVGSGDVTFLQGTSAELPVGGTVPATLSLSLGAPGHVRGRSPLASTAPTTRRTTANVISTAGDATLSRRRDPGRLANGAFTLSEPLQVAFCEVDAGRRRCPTTP